MKVKVSQVKSSQLSYRAEIDGLRAIAVVSVILYHAQMVLFGRNWFQGGYIGVDIFFVISGYLITRIILNELYEKGAFSFLNFYERRARRILPMLLVVGFFCVIAGWKFLLPSDYVSLSESILSSLTFWSNYFFYYESIEYDTASSLLKPFLHTWSLSVEEQFYLVFPIFALISFKYFKSFFLPILVVLLFASLLFSEVMVKRDWSLNFYLPYSRFWELAVGAVLAYIELNYKQKNEGALSQALSMLGLYLVAYSVFFFDGKTPHPSFYTIAPILGVTLIIGYSSKNEIVGRLLGSRLLVWTGLISYSAYLWHYPIMAFGRVIDKKIEFNDQLFWVISSFVLAVISYHIIEKPFRNKGKLNRRLFFYILSLSVVAALSANWFVVANDGYKRRVPSFVLRENFDDRFDNLDAYDRCHLLKGENAVKYNEFCVLGKGSKSAYLVGDSHMVAIAFQLLDKLSVADTKLVLMTRGGALLGKDQVVDAVRLQQLEKITDSVVIVGGFMHRQSNAFYAEIDSLYRSLFKKLKLNGNRIVIVYPIPSTDIERQGLAQEYLVHGELLEKRSKVELFDKLTKVAYRFYDSLGEEGVYRVYPRDFLCDERFCYGVKDGVILISDDDHPSNKTAQWIVEQISVALGGS